MKKVYVMILMFVTSLSYWAFYADFASADSIAKLVNRVGVIITLFGMLFSLYNFYIVQSDIAGMNRLKTFMGSTIGSDKHDAIASDAENHKQDGVLEGLFMSTIGSVISGLSVDIGDRLFSIIR